MIEIKIPAKAYVKLLEKMDDCENGWDAADLFHRRIQPYMTEGSYEEYVEACYGRRR